MTDVPAPEDGLRFLPTDGARLQRTLDATPGLSLVVFGAEGCGACRRARAVLRQIAADPALSRAVGPLTVLEVDADRAPGAIADLEIFHLPALRLFRGGEWHAAVDAPLAPAPLALALAAAAAAPPTPSP